MNKRKTLKILATILIVIIVGGILWIAHGFFGNPVSKALARHSAKEYIESTYPQQGLVIEDVGYNFKDGNYYAHVTSPTSVDTHFSVDISMLGEVERDSYYNTVVSGWNTYLRIDEAYRTMVDKVFAAEDFPLKSHIDYGTIPLAEKSTTYRPDEPDYGIELGSLTLDKQYDIKEIAKTGGHIVFYAQDEQVDFKRASELLLLLKEQLDEADIPFYAIDFVLEKPRDEKELPNPDRISINTAHFLYSDIYEEGLALRIEQAHNELMEFYGEQDAKE